MISFLHDFFATKLYKSLKTGLQKEKNNIKKQKNVAKLLYVRLNSGKLRMLLHQHIAEGTVIIRLNLEKLGQWAVEKLGQLYGLDSFYIKHRHGKTKRFFRDDSRSPLR